LSDALKTRRDLQNQRNQEYIKAYKNATGIDISANFHIDDHMLILRKDYEKSRKAGQSKDIVQ
jgi:hypothetical protein